jgi:diguanylate cyclase (GGDEF)-like protein
MEPRRRGTWLCPTDLDRARVTENRARVQRARIIASAAVGFTLLIFAPLYGWWTVLLFAMAAADGLTLNHRTARSPRPEYHVAFAVVWVQLILALAVAFSGGPDSPSLPWIVVPTAFSAIRFRGRVVMGFAASAVLMLLAATFGVDPAGTVDDPTGLIVAVALVISITAVVYALNDAEVKHRGESILDPLTGLLNRSALMTRFGELEEQASLTGEPISLLMCDIDRFKRVNDAHGHSRGDAVLKDLAYEMRKQLRSFELIYRLGGEEFVVVLPGAREKDASEIAERLRGAIEQGRPGGVSVTVSVGVSTAFGKDARFEPLFEEADRALYAAKAEGRNRVSPAARAELAAI